MATKEELLKVLEPNGQAQILKYWDELNESQREQLAQQILEINWPTVTKWAANALKGESAPIPFDKLTPAPYHALITFAPFGKVKRLCSSVRATLVFPSSV